MGPEDEHGVLVIVTSFVLNMDTGIINMEILKPVEEITQPDSRNELLVILDPTVPDSRRYLQFTDQYEAMRKLELTEQVPETVRSAFAVVRMMWLYGWFHWPLYSAAEVHAHMCLEMALQIRCERDGVYAERKKNPKNAGLWWLLREAIERRWIVDGKISYAKRFKPDAEDVTDQDYCKVLLETLPKLRNMMAHPNQHFVGLPGQSDLVIEIVHDLIEQIFH